MNTLSPVTSLTAEGKETELQREGRQEGPELPGVAAPLFVISRVRRESFCSWDNCYRQLGFAFTCPRLSLFN